MMLTRRSPFRMMRSRSSVLCSSSQLTGRIASSFVSTGGAHAPHRTETSDAWRFETSASDTSAR